MKRRHFIKSTLPGTGVIGFGSFPYHLYAGTVKKYPNDRIKLGAAGLEVSSSRWPAILSAVLP
jgi:hypothetical protein